MVNMHCFTVSKRVFRKQPRDNLNFQRRWCSPVTLVSGNIMFVRIFVRVHVEGVKRQWGNQTRIFSSFRRYVFRNLGNETNVITWYYLVRCRRSIDHEIHDIEWPFYVKLRLHAPAGTRKRTFSLAVNTRSSAGQMWRHDYVIGRRWVSGKMDMQCRSRGCSGKYTGQHCRQIRKCRKYTN